MNTEENGIIELELKYCERCGGLWLRIKGKDDVYCATCALRIVELPAPTRRRVTPRLPISDRTEIHGVAAITGMFGEGGNA